MVEAPAVPGSSTSSGAGLRSALAQGRDGHRVRGKYMFHWNLRMVHGHSDTEINCFPAKRWFFVRSMANIYSLLADKTYLVASYVSCHLLIRQ